MINESLEFITTELNTFFKNSFKINEDKVILSNLVNADGSIPLQITDKMVISLVNVEQETVTGNAIFSQNTNSASSVVKNPPVNINLYLLFTAHFTNYIESLKFLSGTIAFFQGQFLFTRTIHPALGPSIDKLVFELVKIDYLNINFLWGAIGTKYIPSTMYKMRMLTFDQNNWKYETPLVSDTASNINS